MINIAKMIDHTALKADTTTQDVKKLISEAKQYGFFSVCINPKYVSMAKKELTNSDTKVCTVIGFPLGANNSKIKALEAKIAIEDGADEIDMVIDIGAAKEHDWDRVRKDIATVKQEITKGVLLKVIIETALLTDDEKINVCQICSELKVDFVKTSTGFSTKGATVDDVKLMNKYSGDNVKVKASGGIKTKQDAEEMIKAGASRLGTSNGVSII